MDRSWRLLERGTWPAAVGLVAGMASMALILLVRLEPGCFYDGECAAASALVGKMFLVLLASTGPVIFLASTGLLIAAVRHARWRRHAAAEADPDAARDLAGESVATRAAATRRLAIPVAIGLLAGGIIQALYAANILMRITPRTPNIVIIGLAATAIVGIACVYAGIVALASCPARANGAAQITS